MGRLKRQYRANVANLRKATSKVAETLDHAANGLKRLAAAVTPRKTPAKKRRLDISENTLPSSLPPSSTTPVPAHTIADDPFATPSPLQLFNRSWSIPSPRKRLFGVFKTDISVPATPSTPSTMHEMTVQELVAPGVLPRVIPEFSLSTSTRRRRTVSVHTIPEGDNGSVRHLALAERAVPLGDDFVSDDEDDHAADVPRTNSTSTSSTAPLPPTSSPPALPDGMLRQAPTIAQAIDALRDLRLKFRVPRKTGPGWVTLQLNPFERDRLEGMRNMLNFYTDAKSKTYGHWAASSLQAAVTLERGVYCARVLRRMVRAFIADRTVLPINPYGDWKTSMLSDEDLGNALMLHLQELRDGFTCTSIVQWLARPDIKEQYGISKTVSESTARRWLLALNYRYRYEARGQYVDGHERKDVVWYRRDVYIPAIQALLQRTMEYNHDGSEIHPRPREFYMSRQVIIWYHDESIFYAHDRRCKRWFHKDASPKPYKKGEGVSLMIADFVSAEFGWLRSPDGKESAQETFHPGANRDGYYTNTEIRAQATKAADLVTTHYPQFEHVFVYDNATTHRKRADDALSARHMPKMPSESLAKNWLVERNVIYAPTGRPERLPNNKFRKERIRMADTKNPLTGAVQSLYFPDDHPTKPGIFKGMSQILIERGWDPAPLARGAKPVECSGFKCSDVTPSATCCVRHILFNQPDFANVPSLLETDMQQYNIRILFLPKFHCELNPIEQCWGYAKRIYRLNPLSSRDDILWQNTLKALEAVPLITIRRFFNRAHRFVDAYDRGLDGQQSAWACKKYRGHRTIPEWILDDLEKAGLKK